jgi:hypothetical protein
MSLQGHLQVRCKVRFSVQVNRRPMAMSVRTKVSADDAMPSRIILLIKLFLDVCRDVLLNGVFLDGLGAWAANGTLHFAQR